MVSKSKGRIVGVDVGGTFTDLVYLDQAAGTLKLAKTPTTLDNQAFGVLAALDAAGVDAATLDLIVHGTTTTTNAVLERQLAKTGLITTMGFRDVLELGRRTRPQPYGMTGQFRPVIPRDLRLEIPERMDADGEVVTPLDEPAFNRAAETLLAEGCEAIVVHFLHSYANPAHELRAGALLRDLWPNDYITLGHALLPESREFERGVTAAVNASVQPIIERYVRRLTQELGTRGYTRDVLVMNGNGGMVSAGRVSQEAAKTVMSGPASGVMAAAYTGRRAGLENLVTYDMGGTSTDVSLILDGAPGVSSEIELEYAMPIHVPMVDVRTVGAGGGSIARIDEAGLLQVGPESAGASPGPICYGRGGTRPTISDANLLLGRLDPSRLNSVKGGVGLEEVNGIFARDLGAPLGLTAHDAASAVLRIANARMAGAVRMVSISLGHDPRDFALFAFGGAGPLHAHALARELGIPKVLIPARPGITNALGCAVADLRHDFVNSVLSPLDALDLDRLHAVFARQIETGRAMIEAEQTKVESIHVTMSLDMQFQGQTHVLRVPLGDARPNRKTLSDLFATAYFERFQVELPEIRPVVVSANTTVVGQRPEIDLTTLIDATARKATLKDAQTGTRRIWFETGWHDTPIYWRDYLPKAAELSGPAIVEQFDTTIVIEPGGRASCDAIGNLVVEVT